MKSFLKFTLINLILVSSLACSSQSIKPSHTSEASEKFSSEPEESLVLLVKNLVLERVDGETLEKKLGVPNYKIPESDHPNKSTWSYVQKEKKRIVHFTVSYGHVVSANLPLRNNSTWTLEKISSLLQVPKWFDYPVKKEWPGDMETQYAVAMDREAHTFVSIRKDRNIPEIIDFDNQPIQLADRKPFSVK